MNSVDLLGLVIAILIASLTAYLAKGRGRNPILWFFVGGLFGIFGLLALFFFPILKIEDEAVQTVVKPSPVVPQPPPVHDAISQTVWHYLDAKHTQLGPVKLSGLQELWAGKEITPATYVWSEGMQNWKKISELPELQKRLQPITE